ncbi:CBS domain-containing protein [Sphingobacterium oryzagri]|uniref:CBS domain-containing protein n=1 Tax=Sphingobacterium oryzagri TaxID=3025669 RepID=A0ABY7WLR4_9SPHI|nr:CBS domain-containing protein [Sphingobacterium sp. KACC 22765]WDF69945.1 CBS domain-containing protein [Sphingobacterium sp. KACC 22765]
MYLGEILSKHYFDVKPDDSIGFALDRMNEFHMTQLPVVSEHDFLGLLTEDQLLAADDETQSLHNLSVSLRFVYLYEYQHVYDALQYMSAHQLQLLPVVDKDNVYLGTLTQQEVLHALNDTLGNREPGAIIVLELGRNDVSFSHIAHLFESENVRILSTAVRDIPDTTKIEMTIKVDKQNISTLIASLWRFDYVVKATFNDGSPDSDIKERYDILMNYLNL